MEIVILQFPYAKKRKSGLQLQCCVVFFLQMAKAHSRPMGEMALQIWEIEDLARKANDAS